MKASSAEWKKNVYEDNRKFVYKTDITLADGTVLHVDNSQIMQNGVSFSGATSESGVFSIGSMVSSKVTVRLNNMYDDFSAYDFTNATAYVYVGMLLSETTEWLKMGQFNVESPTTRTSIISLEMLDNLSKTDKVYVPKVTFPCTRLQLAWDACIQSGLYLNTTNFYGWNQSVVAFDITSTMTCRQILSYIAQVGCLYGMCDENGYLNFKWYDTTSLDSFRTNMDGGNFTDYTSGTTVDGGDFTDYSSGDVLDGGSFTDMDDVVFVYSIKSQEINTDDVVITGVKITYQYSDDETKELKVGTDGYVIGISENPLINKGNVQAIANYIYSIIGGLTFRPLTVNALADPRVEAGDIGVVIDSKQNVYPCIFTTLSVTYGGYETYTCDAESAARNSSDSFSAMTQAIVVARENTKKQITSHDQAVQRLTNLMTNCFGVFKTEEVQDDGSVIYYMHDKSTLADSMTIWKMTADGFAVSTDGGANYGAGFDAQGNAVFNVLNAIGINADWINSGTLTVGGMDNKSGTIKVLDSNGKTIGLIDKDGYRANNPTDANTYTKMSDGGLMSKGINAGDSLELYVSKGGLILKDLTTGDEMNLYGDELKLYCKNAKTRLWNTDGVLLLDTGVDSLADPDIKDHAWLLGHDFCQFDTSTDFFKNVYFEESVKISNEKRFNGTDSAGNTINLAYISSTDNVHLGNSGYNAYVHTKGYQLNITSTQVAPSATNPRLGNSGDRRWGQIYSTSTTISTSDRRMKNTIEEIAPVYEEIFMRTPTYSYFMNGGDRRHFGTVSQEVETLIEQMGLTATDFAPFCKDPKRKIEYDDDGNVISDTPILDESGNQDYEYSFRYGEYIMLTVHMVQKVTREFQEYRAQKDNEIANLKSKVEKQERLIMALCEKVGVEYGNN